MGDCINYQGAACILYSLILHDYFRQRDNFFLCGISKFASVNLLSIHYIFAHILVKKFWKWVTRSKNYIWWTLGPWGGWLPAPQGPKATCIWYFKYALWGIPIIRRRGGKPGEEGRENKKWKLGIRVECLEWGMGMVDLGMAYLGDGRPKLLMFVSG